MATRSATIITGAAIFLALLTVIAIRHAPTASAADDVPAGLTGPSAAAMRKARAWARDRPGTVSFSVSNTGGPIRGLRVGHRTRSASLSKAMLLVAALRAARHRSLYASEQRRLYSMIHVSDNHAASVTFHDVGNRGLRTVGDLVGMRDLRLGDSWSTAQLAPGDQVRLFLRIDRLVPSRHRAFARHALRDITSSQRWGIRHVIGSRCRVLFKGGWLPRPGGWIVNQSALIEVPRHDGKPADRRAISVLTSGSPTMGRGVGSIQGVARRLTRDLDCG